MDSLNPKPPLSQWLPPTSCSFFHVPNPETTTFGAQEVVKPSINNVEAEDDLFAAYIDMEKLEERKGRKGKGRGKKKEKGNNVKTETMKRERIRSRKKSQPANDAGMVEPRKAMVAEELAQLWIIDPKRAKRIMANRQSAARSKERKAQHIQHLEEKVKTLTSEVASLNTQIAIIQRETTHLAAERSELELQLMTMHQHIEISHAQSEELQLEVIRLKTAIRDNDSSNKINVGVNNTPQGQSNALSTLFQNAPITLSQHEVSMLHASQQNILPHHMQTTDSPSLLQLLQLCPFDISEVHKTSSGQFLANGESLSTSLTTGKSSTISY